MDLSLKGINEAFFTELVAVLGPDDDCAIMGAANAW